MSNREGAPSEEEVSAKLENRGSSTLTEQELDDMFPGTPDDGDDPPKKMDQNFVIEADEAQFQSATEKLRANPKSKKRADTMLLFRQLFVNKPDIARVLLRYRKKKAA
jgi:hypothetical protein